MFANARRRGAAILMTGLLGSAFATVGPSLAAEQTVSAEVTALSSTACLELSATTIDFGELPFGAVYQPADPTITVTNCATVDGDILAKGTNATGDGGAVWSISEFPDTSCDTSIETMQLAPGYYILRVDLLPGGIPISGQTYTAITTLAPGAEKALGHRIDMPCPGSPGGGQTMSFEVTYLAVTEPAP